MRILTRTLQCAVLVILILSTSAQETLQASKWDVNSPRVRARFVVAIKQINTDRYLKQSSTAKEVLALLGEPDDIVTQTDPFRIGNAQVKERWCYGTNGHLTLPTLGTVTINTKDQVIWVAGSFNGTPSVELISEEKLRSILRAIDRNPHGFLNADGFNPREMIVLIDTLRALGKDKALAVLREYSRIHSWQYGLDGGRNAIIIMRFLFEVPDGELHPTTYLPFEEHKTKDYPAIPAAVIEGVPFLLFPLGGWGLGGGLPNVDEYLDWYKDHGVLRKDSLRPANDPQQVWKQWQTGLRINIAAMEKGQATGAERLVQTQLLRMIDTIHPRDFDEDMLMRVDISASWANAIKTLTQTDTRWDEQHNCYVRVADGSFIEPVPEPIYKRAIWTLPFKEQDAQVVLHRLSEEWVRLMVEQVADGAPPLPSMKVHVFAINDPETEIASANFKGGVTSGSSASNTTFRLKKGTALRASLILNDQVVEQSDVLLLDQRVERRK